jgi:hypothetical protein
MKVRESVGGTGFHITQAYRDCTLHCPGSGSGGVQSTAKYGALQIRGATASLVGVCVCVCVWVWVWVWGGGFKPRLSRRLRMDMG